ncbi:LacI family DNA-binding transcriptional regulator [Amycolatopsis sp. NPDC059657]|uniref:LacI family DNA-binding transcriptional regulator n=1 Tax=Amycolatopsis sp. NPDC059657 TaxID=3346899 RepID=UPI003670C345
MTNSHHVARETPESGRGAVTIVDVAHAAGVSPSTVSYVITGKRPISPGTRRRVEESIRVLGYRRPGGTLSRVGVLALSVPLRVDRHLDIEMEFFSAAAATARDLQFDLLLVTRDEGTSGLHRVLAGALADAAIMTDIEDDDPRVPILLASGRPAVLIGVPGPVPGLACVDLDFAAAGKACLTHLADLGHRSIAVIGSSPPHQQGYRRSAGFLEGFTAAAAHRGVHQVVRRCAPSPETVVHCLDELLSAGDPTGLVVQDQTALPLVFAALERRGLRVPTDVSVVAVCSETVAGQQRIRPTAAIVPARRLGALVVELAVRQLDGEPAELEPLTPQFIPGDSTAAALRP